MLLPLRVICNHRTPRRDGTCVIYIQYCYSSEHRTVLNTEIAIPAAYWNKRKECINADLPKQYGIAAYLNEELKRMYRQVEDIIAYAEKNGIRDKAQFLKTTFKPNADFAGAQQDNLQTGIAVAPTEKKKNADDLFFQIDDFIKSKQNKVSKATINIFKGMKEHLMAYEAHTKKPLTFRSFDFVFYEAFVDFLTFDYVQKRKKEFVVGLRTNTIGKTIKQLRRFLADRVKRKIVAPIDLTDFKIPNEETDAIYLSYEEIGRIYNADLSKHPHLIEYRDLFVLACLTGLRFSDFSTLRQEDLKNGMLHKKMNKTDHWVVIPLRKEARKIFSNQFTDKLKVLTNPEFNRHIKTVGKLAGLVDLITFSYKKGNKDIENIKPKYDWITTHTARRSFCTNEFLAGTPVKLIMQISGHKNEIDLYRYIRITPHEAAQKIKELWQERDQNMQVFLTSKVA